MKKAQTRTNYTHFPLSKPTGLWYTVYNFLYRFLAVLPVYATRKYPQEESKMKITITYCQQ